MKIFAWRKIAVGELDNWNYNNEDQPIDMFTNRFLKIYPAVVLFGPIDFLLLSNHTTDSFYSSQIDSMEDGEKIKFNTNINKVFIPTVSLIIRQKFSETK